MAIRKIIEIDEEKCDGCGLCVTACHEGAIQMINDKAKLVSEIYCDGLGDCIGECPQDAITIVEREASDFDEAAVAKHLAANAKPEEEKKPLSAFSGCPGSAMKNFNKEVKPFAPVINSDQESMLGHWPIQLMLVPPIAPFLKNADLVICADCVPFAVPDFHSRYLSGKAVVVGCPKLDDLQHYYDKLRSIFTANVPKRITVLKMEVPCCSGIAQAAIQAHNETIPEVPIEIHTIGVQGGITFEKVTKSNVA